MTWSSNGLYNLTTYVWHKMLHRPIVMKPLFVRKVKNPRLTVIFLHGTSATSETWRITMRQFSRNPELDEISFYALDLLGFGKSLQSDWLDYDYHDYEQALESTMKKFRIKTPVVLIGHSMGALIAADFAVNFPTKFDICRLILVSPPVLMNAELAKLPDKAYTKSYSSLQKIAAEEPAVEVLANFIQRFSSFRSKYLRTPAFGKSMDQIILNRKNYQTFTNIKTPTLLIHGHFDPLVMYSNLKRVADHNTHVRFASVMGHHDVSSHKRTKILIELKKTLREIDHETI